MKQRQVLDAGRLGDEPARRGVRPLVGRSGPVVHRLAIAELAVEVADQPPADIGKQDVLIADE